MSLYDQILKFRKGKPQKEKPENMIAVLNGEIIKLFFDYHEDTISEIRLIMGRKWHKDAKFWSVPNNKHSVGALKKIGFIMPEGIDKPKKINLDFEKGLKLYPFQQEGLKGIEEFNGRVLLADEMGLGKTIQAIAYMKQHPELCPVLIVCPAGLKYNWQKEIKKWLNEDSTIISGKSKVKINDRINIINYEILSCHEKELIKINPKLIIGDEFHYCKNYKAMRSKVFAKLAKKVKKLITITGTPITSKPAELFNQLRILHPNTFNNWSHFANRYCDPKSNGFAIEYKGASNTDELNKILLDTCMIRRLKKDVTSDLPDKVVSVIPIKETIGYCSEDPYEEKRKQTFEIKKVHIKEWVENFLENNDKLVIMTDRKRSLDFIEQEFSGMTVRFDGDTSAKQKNEAVERFQNDPKIKIFAGNIKAAGVGITLTAADTALFIEYNSVPGMNIQAEDRIHRIGQKNTCFIYYLMVENTVDQTIVEKIDYKRQGLDGVMDGEVKEENRLLTS